MEAAEDDELVPQPALIHDQCPYNVCIKPQTEVNRDSMYAKYLFGRDEIAGYWLACSAAALRRPTTATQ